MEIEKLTTRQHRLKDWLKENFVSGKYFTIEEICNAGLGYKLNTNPYTHDKCVALGNDVKKLNWKAGIERYIPIIKDKYGSIKLCENKEELDAFVQGEKKKVENANKYANHLASLAELDGSILFINQADRVLTENELQPTEVFKR